MKSTQAALFALLVITMMGSCSDYSKVLKSKDQNVKFDKAVEYYNDGDCFKSLPLFEELIGLERGTIKAEQIYYYYAQTHYCIGDYYLANYYFKNFVKTYPNSKYSEECLFMAARCSFENSPKSSLDQTETRRAIDEFQLFLDRYPSSSLKDSSNTIIAGLRSKLERKSFEKAKLYEKTGYYRAAVLALQSAIKEFPDSKYREEMMFLIVKSEYLLAFNSIENKKLIRFEETSKFYYTFVAAFPKSKFVEEAEKYFKASLKEMDRIKGNFVR